MSFSSEVKDELKKAFPNSRHCRLAELAALVTMSGSFDKFTWNENDDEDGESIKKRINKLASMLQLDINSEEGHKALKLIKKGSSYTIDRILLERSCCKQAYIRGAFLANGSVTNPEKGYHFEFVCKDEEQAKLILDIVSGYDIQPKQTMRKKYHVVYVKEASQIADLLSLMGAYKSLMDMENVRILKDMINSVNRKVNCETANINKTVNAAMRQITDIRYIEEHGGLKMLPENLRELARLRIEEPDTSLKELGEQLSPPLGKSGVNHRLRKISEIAEELRRKTNV